MVPSRNEYFSTALVAFSLTACSGGESSRTTATDAGFDAAGTGGSSAADGSASAGAPGTRGDGSTATDANSAFDASTIEAGSDADITDAGGADVAAPPPRDASPEAKTPPDSGADKDAAPDPTASEGVPSEPVDITGALPYEGFRGSRPSYYVVTGLEPNTVYTITLTMLEGVSGITVPNAPGGEITCTPNSGQTVVQCAAMTDDLANLKFSTWKTTPSERTTYRLEIAEGGVVNQGTFDNPFIVTSLPLTVDVLTRSYYVVTGLVPGGAYTVGPLPSESLSMSLYPTADFFGVGSVCVLVGIDNFCVYEADESGKLYFAVAVNDHQWGFTDTLPIEPGGVPNQGYEEVPKDLTGSLPFDGSVHRRHSYYRITGLNPDAVYTLALGDLTDRVRVEFWGAGQAVPYFDCYADSSDQTAVTCAGLSASDGSIEVIVDGTRSANGASYTLGVTPGGLPNEGYIPAYKDITGQVPHAGTVHIGGSFYKVTGLATDRTYTVGITGMSGDIDLSVSDRGPSANGCAGFVDGLADELCDVQTSTGELYIQALFAGNPSGATFTVDVQEKAATDGG